MDKTTLEGVSEKECYLYAVLNLPKGASEAEINERHRSLSLIFHPDKQRVEHLKEAATAEYLEIQKAYQILSDPFLRQVYDTLGYEGLKIKWPPYVRSRSKEEIQKFLEHNEVVLKRESFKQYMLSKGKISCGIDVSSLFEWSDEPYTSDDANAPWFSRVWERLSNVRSFEKRVSYSIQKKLSDKTSVSFESKATVQTTKGTSLFLGTLRHQFSPRITASATLGPFFPYTTRFEVQYEDPHNELAIKTTSHLINPFSLPLTTISFSRRLFRSKPQQGKIILNVSKNPQISFVYRSPATIELEEGDALPQQAPPTTSGLRYMLVDKAVGLDLHQVLPAVFAEVGLTLVELSVRFRCIIQMGFNTTVLTVGANWSSETAEVGSAVSLTNTGVLLHVDLRYLEQQLSLPIVLSTERSPLLALGTVVIPSCAAALGYHFIVLPRRRKRRLEYLRAMKKDLEEGSDARQRKIAVEEILKDPAKKQTRLETEREGLIIQEATYGAADTDDATENVSLDVTIPLQALVRNSQLHIPGGDTKAALQGFSDPAPFASKSLRIRYLFHGRVHYAEIPDFLPVVLPLAEHQVNDTDCLKEKR
ncbi:DnaJ-domain-containing protein [Pholiota conissans]|uniref:DnaJ-domain-containing protein n=1 Tax=Pholiota conissans TaxID=109636 RepID=A0A9P5Z7U2_9AGAR|nr:DnaJ-domain-containing protein [Pholiota conissans]